MTAIVGLLRPQGQTVRAADLCQMLASMPLHGRGHEAIWQLGNVGLGARPLLAGPAQAHHRLTGNVAVADVRLDNRDELLRDLDTHAGLFDPPGLSDTALLLACYERYGTDFVSRLLGDFAFALWDVHKRRLVCARDCFGVRPLYYHCRPPHGLALGSEIKALLALPQVVPALDEDAVAGHLALLRDDAVGTFYQGVSLLPAGYLLVSDGHCVHKRRYFRLRPCFDRVTRDLRENAACFRELLTEAVLCRVADTDRVGLELSAGLDSSSVACTAARLQGRRSLHTFSATFGDDTPADARGDIEAIVERYPALEPHYLPASHLSPLTDIERIHHGIDEPLEGPNWFVNWAVLREAQGEGLRVLLCGYDGDTTVSYGVCRLAELARSLRLVSLARDAGMLARRLDRPSWRVLWDHALRPWVPPSALGRARALRDTVRARPDHWGWIDPDFARRTHLRQRAAAQQSAAHRATRGALRQHLHGFVGGQAHSRGLATMSAAAGSLGIEYRYPYLDRRLVEFCLAVPSEHKLAEGWVRAIQRHAMDGLLPPPVCWRPRKSSMAPNFHRSLLAYGRETIEDTVCKPAPELSPFVDAAALRLAVQGLANTGPGDTGPGDLVCLRAVWLSMTLALWLRQTGLQM